MASVRRRQSLHRAGVEAAWAAATATIGAAGAAEAGAGCRSSPVTVAKRSGHRVDQADGVAGLIRLVSLGVHRAGGSDLDHLTNLELVLAAHHLLRSAIFGQCDATTGNQQSVGCQRRRRFVQDHPDHDQQHPQGRERCHEPPRKPSRLVIRGRGRHGDRPGAIVRGLRGIVRRTGGALGLGLGQFGVVPTATVWMSKLVTRFVVYWHLRRRCIAVPIWLCGA